jgi:lipopolysaccharide/colanic/teichoic acid biosynthesis glycosyltransferase/glycosyltransferase involved in cell wall biosynthesis
MTETVGGRPHIESGGEPFNPMRLVHITTVPESLAFFDGQVGYLRSMGISVSAVSSPGDRLNDFGARHGIDVHPVAMRRRISPIRDLAAVLRLWMLLRRLRPDVVHTSTPKAGLLGMIAAFLAGVPVRVFHNLGLPHLSARGIKRLLLRLSSHLSCALAHRIFCVSYSMSQESRGLGVSDRAVVLGHGSVDGVDAEGRFNPEVVPASAGVEFRVANDIPLAATVVTFVGRLVRDKGLVELARAWDMLSDGVPSAYLVIAGEFEPQDPIPAEVRRQLCEHPRVRLCGFVRDTPALYKASDLLLLPTYREGFGNVVIEASAMALPVVATRVPGCIDSVEDGVTGVLVHARDAASLAGAIRAYLLSPALRLAHGQAGRERVLRDFRPEPIRRQSLEEYRHLLGVVRARRHRFLFRVKQPLDILASAAALTALWPLMAVVAAVIRARLGSPVIFRQVRPGLNGQPFTIRKFRTMRDAVDAAGSALPDSQRLTTFGRWLRTTSLDELPALWNVVKGDMSLVGPRPLLPEYLPRYSPEQRRRHDVKPGLTGWAQVNGRNGLSWSEKFELDLWYVDNRSFLLDMKIILLTVLTLVRRSGIAQPGHVTMPKFMGDHPEANS